MTLKFGLWTLLLYEIITISSPSIVGVTYRDHFDFEERYRDVNECNPFHWHPLHLPEYCADLYEQLIRAKLGNRTPLRVMVDRHQHPESGYDYGFSHLDSAYEDQLSQTGYKFNEQTVNFYSTDTDDYSSSDEENNNYSLEKPDYERVLEQLRKDVAKNPSVAEVGIVPNIGPAYIYKQEVSKKSEDMIKDLGTNYAKALEKMYADQLQSEKSNNDPELYVWDSRKNKTNKIVKNDKKKKNKRRLNRKRFENNGLVTIIETLSPKTRRRRRSALYFYES